MIERLTVGQMKRALKNVPDDAIISCWSDEEGNRDTVCMSVGVYKVGRKRQIQGYKYIEGEETIGIDLEADKGKTLVTFQPMY